MSAKDPFADRTLRAVTQQQVADDFDRLTESYERKINDAIAFGGYEHSFYINVKRDRILKLAAEHFPNPEQLEALDLGCGVGAYHPGLEGKFRRLHGIDVSHRSVDVARQKYPFVHYETFDGERLPYSAGAFDLIFMICVMHHVPPPQWQDLTSEIYRVLKPGGLALVFEHNPYNPATQYIVKSCEIDKDAVLLRPHTLRKLFRNAGFEAPATRSILSVPPVGPLLTQIDEVLGHLSFGAQYYLSASKPAQ